MKASATVRIENNILRVELIKKWVRARRGRMTVLARATGQNKNAFPHMCERHQKDNSYLPSQSLRIQANHTIFNLQFT